MRGRKPLPTHLKLVKGNPGRRPVNESEPTPVLAIPPVPPELCDDGKLEWGRICGELYSLNLLSHLDRGALTALCDAWGAWVRGRRALEKMAAKDPVFGGMVIKTKDGNMIQNPLIGLVNKARADYVRFAAEFGMTPSARARVNGGPQKSQNQDPAAKFF